MGSGLGTLLIARDSGPRFDNKMNETGWGRGGVEKPGPCKPRTSMAGIADT